jgi:hypothetical protein
VNRSCCDQVGWRDDGALRGRSYCQGLWISGFQATSDPAVSGSVFDVSGVMSMGSFEQFALVEHRACTDEGDQVGDFGGQVNLDTAGGLFDIIVRELKSRSLFNEGVYKIFTRNPLIEIRRFYLG